MTEPQDNGRRKPSLSLPIIRRSRKHHNAGTLTLGNLLEDLGERSFGWAIVVFSLVTLLPLPPGSSLITALPVLLTTGQMMFGFPYVRLPGPLARLKLDHHKLRRTLLRLHPVTRRLERTLRPRILAMFTARHEPLLGLALFIVSFTLFLPIPFSGWFPAFSLFIVGVGLVERDGVVAILGLVSGALSVMLTIAIVVSFAVGTEAIIE
ncbi:exopolysaccharide synthesis protein ExoD-related protein [Rhodovulum sp. P5]|uniref:exopolysaccharide biosynthesis protein n=1 Tax=Rhodovulum sp. P5 TaxID=1564506 RepID=UPI0009C2DE7D|nr:exopolysaccharide biosynthesis protein [Rhodovulum sp. P5]ARE41303.1 exopolysaccharide synthesis protein ExoD-related protein [Rhodovulum sp. P5]